MLYPIYAQSRAFAERGFMMRKGWMLIGVAVVAPAHAQSVQYLPVQYRSSAGVEYRSLPDTGPVARAASTLAADPQNVAKIIALGVAQSGARRYREAIATFTSGMSTFPNNVPLYRWRGHRFISVREFDRAMEDLTRGFQLDSTVYGVLYHLGIVRFARGDFNGAADMFRRALPNAPDPAETAGATDWLWMSLSRAGRADDARAMLASRPDSLPITNAYTQRIKLYRGKIGPEAVAGPADTTDIAKATVSYGLGNWYLVRGDSATARQWFRRSIEPGGLAGLRFYHIRDRTQAAYAMIVIKPGISGSAEASRTKIVAMFRLERAVTSRRAITVDLAKIDKSTFRRLQEAGIIQESEPGKFWLHEGALADAESEVLAYVQRFMPVIGAIALAVAGVIWLIS